MKQKITKLREEARQCVQVADKTADNKVAAALLAYACELEQRARLIESAKKHLDAEALTALRAEYAATRPA
jgi:hypothetical protein